MALLARIEQGYVPVERPPRASTAWRLADKLSDENRAAIVATYQAGDVTMASLATQFGVSDYSIRKVLRRAGIRSSYKSISADLERQTRHLRAEGHSIAQVARECGIPESTVRLLLEGPDLV